jgi:hypothetical protein
MTLGFIAPASFVATLALLSFVAGCSSASDAPRDLGPSDMGRAQPDLASWDGWECEEVAPAVRYRITDLHVPTAADVNAGLPLGHNVDRMGEVCGIPDFADGVDNALIEFTSELPMLNPPEGGLVLQDAIDSALNCAADADPGVCTRLDIIIEVTPGTYCAFVEMEDGEGESLGGRFVGSLDESGLLRGTSHSVGFSVPYYATGGVVDIDLPISNFMLTALVGEDALTDIVLGGVIISSAFEAMLMEVLAALGDEPSFEDVAPILASLYDVEANGVCSALSVGFTATATRVTAP